MASDLNKVIVIGRMVKDPDIRSSPNGAQVSSFSIASNRTYVVGGEKKEEVSYFDCVAWGKLAEVIVQYCKKGHRVGIEGRLQQQRWDDPQGNKRSTVKITVENFQFLTPRESSMDHQTEVPMPEPEMPGNPGMDNPFSDNDIPF